MKELILKLLDEVDLDIKEIMLKIHEEKGYLDGFVYQYEHYKLLIDPVNAILNWQAMRDRKKK